jgi:hypothetical protein
MPRYQYAYLHIATTVLIEQGPATMPNGIGTQKEGPVVAVFNSGPGITHIHVVDGLLGGLNEYGAQGWIFPEPAFASSTAKWISKAVADEIAGVSQCGNIWSCFMRREAQ